MQITQGVSVGLAALRRNKLRSVLTTLGIIIGIAAVVAVVSVGGGAEHLILIEMERIGGAGMIVCFRKDHIRREDGSYRENKHPEYIEYEDLAFILETCPSLKTATAQSGMPRRVSHRHVNQSLQVHGVTPTFQDVNNWYVKTGRFFTNEEMDRREPICLIGSEVHKDFFQMDDPIGKEMKIDRERFTVIGVMEEKGNMMATEGWDNRVIIPLLTMGTRFIGQRKGWIVLFGQAESYEKVEQAVAEIKVAFRQLHGDEKYFDFFTAKEMIKQVGNVSRIVQVLLGAVASIALFVGGIGIMNIMLVSVTERTREIGLRKAIGAKRTDILIQFLIEAIVLSICGGLIGIFIGSGLATGSGWIISTFLIKDAAWPAIVSVKAAVIAFCVSACIGIFFGIYPANKASRLTPTEALRHV
ncbi:MAG: ABC transporter permease [Candidatus Poribacteria bacterium]|nr:ABC transporter permease [Candidatus Poribacteria bacterium]